jgi:HEAT repeat protein
MNGKIGRFFNVRQEESVHVAYLLFHYFFQGIGLALFFTVANALFLSRFSVEDLPLVYISSAVAILVLGRLFALVGSRWPMQRTLKAITIFITFTVLIAYLGAANLKLAWIPIALYIWYQVISRQIDTEFWGLSSIIFDVRQAKRLYGLISVGDVPAKLLGYLSVAFLVPSIGLVNLLLIATASFLAGAVLLNRLLSKLKPHHFVHHDHAIAENGKNTIKQNFFVRFFQSDLVMALAVLYFVGAITLTFTEFSFLAGVEHKFHTEAELAYFFARVFAFGNGIIIVCKLFLSGKAIERLGIKKSLLSLPLFVLLTCIAVGVTGKLSANETPIMWLFAAMVVFADVFKAVLYEPLFLALFQPLPGHIRHRAHSIVNDFVNPLGLAVSGLALYIGIELYHGINLYKIDYVLIVLTIGWILLVYYTTRKYMATLKAAINIRLIGSGQLMLGDQKSIDVLMAKLKSTRPDEVIYTAEMLCTAHPGLFELAIPQLISHEAPEIRLYALQKTYELKLKTDSEELYKIINSDSSIAVMEVAVKVYCTLHEDIVDRITPMLDHPLLAIRSAAIKGFLKSGDMEPMILGGQKLLKMLQSIDNAELIAAIAIIGDLGFKNYYKPVLEFLHHAEASVRKAAVEACGKLNNPKIIPFLIPCLEDKALKKVTFETLSTQGEPVFEYLKATELGGKYTEEAIRLCARIGGTRAAAILFSDYFGKAKGTTLDEVLKSLIRLNFDEKMYRHAIDVKLEEVLDFGYTCLLMVCLLEKGHHAVTMLRAITEELDNTKNRIFLLLSMVYDRQTIEKARNASFSDQKELRANALEYLENSIDRDLKLKLFPLLEDMAAGKKAELLSKLYTNHELSSINDLTARIIKPEPDFLPWTQALAIYTYPEKAIVAVLEPYMASEEKLLAQCASFALAQRNHTPKSQGPKTHENMKTEHQPLHETMLEIEKILILKSTSMFAATPENILVGIAGIAREERKQKGEDVFRKDDLGNCLYIICEGDIYIHIDGKQLSVLHSRDIFGELALLDPEPRSASATAADDCLLLRIDQAAFNELIEERPEVAQGILTILSKRIRGQNELIRNLQQLAVVNNP